MLSAGMLVMALIELSVEGGMQNYWPEVHVWDTAYSVLVEEECS